MTPLTIYDSQSGKLVKGVPENLTEFSFEIIQDGQRYVFSRDNLPEEVEKRRKLTLLKIKE